MSNARPIEKNHNSTRQIQKTLNPNETFEQLQQRTNAKLAEQDILLDQVLVGVENLKEIGFAINNELQKQDQTLNQIKDNLDTANHQTKKAIIQADKLEKQIGCRIL